MAVEVAVELLVVIGRGREVEGQAAEPLLAKVGAVLKALVSLHLRPLTVLEPML